MLVKIKNYLKLRKLRRDALSLLIINSAEIISAFKDVTDLVHSYLGDTAEIQKKLSGENMDTVLKFMVEMVAAPDFKDKMYEKIHDDAQKLREMEAAK